MFSCVKKLKLAEVSGVLGIHSATAAVLSEIVQYCLEQKHTKYFSLLLTSFGRSLVKHHGAA